MAIYRCSGCDRMVDDDYEPGTDDGTEDFGLLCESCAEDLPHCSSCSEACETVEETFDYSGTHCSHGKSGTHHTGNYISKCCLAELESK